MAESTVEPQKLNDDDVQVELTHSPLDIVQMMRLVKRDDAGAVVTFTGTTRNTFQSRTVIHLSYSAYPALALRSMMTIAKAVKAKHDLKAIAIVHRLGEVPVGEESIIIAVSSPHRQAAWRAGEEALEDVKAKVEIWKYEQFEDGGAWRANRDGTAGVEVQESNAQQ